MPRFVTGFARIQYALNSGESSYGCFPPAARLSKRLPCNRSHREPVRTKNGFA